MSGRYAHVVVEELRCKVGPVGPDESAKLRMNTELFEDGNVLQRFENRTSESRTQIDRG